MRLSLTALFFMAAVAILFSATGCRGSPTGDDGGSVTPDGEERDGNEGSDAAPDGDASTGEEETGENHPPLCVCDPREMESEVYSTVTLSASGCTDPDGDRLDYAWIVVSRPAGSTAAIMRPNAHDPTFFLDMIGRYVFQVTATDPAGASSSCQVTVESVHAVALNVVLVWDQDLADLDIHLLNPAGSGDPTGPGGWFSIPNDCHYSNVNPNWGDPGDTGDDPRQVIDDVSGYGPESIEISAPASGVYTVGVHYFCDKKQGPSDATVRIYCHGTLSDTVPARRLGATGEFWQAATVSWPDCQVTALDTSFTVSEGCPP